MLLVDVNLSKLKDFEWTQNLRLFRFYPFQNKGVCTKKNDNFGEETPQKGFTYFLCFS